MTREQLVVTISNVISATDDFDFGADGIGRLADVILAEMAGEWQPIHTVWNVGLEAAAQFVEGLADHGCMTQQQLAGNIRALRRPDAAPARPATPSVEEVARTICCPSGKCRAEESGRPYKCNWQGETEEATAVLALFAKERS